MGRDGSGGAGWARVMQSEGLTGERGRRRSFGRSVADGTSSWSEGGPRGIDEAHERIPASPRPIQELRGEGARGSTEHSGSSSKSSTKKDSRSKEDMVGWREGTEGEGLS